MWYHPQNRRLWIRLNSSVDLLGTEQYMFELSMLDENNKYDLAMLEMLYPGSSVYIGSCLEHWINLEFKSSISEWLWITQDGLFFWHMGVDLD